MNISFGIHTRAIAAVPLSFLKFSSGLWPSNQSMINPVIHVLGIESSDRSYNRMPLLPGLHTDCDWDSREFALHEEKV